MPNQIDRRGMTRWLLSHGFTELTGKASSHRRYRHEPSGVVITLPGHGPQDLTKKHAGMIMRELERAGFSREQLGREIWRR